MNTILIIRELDRLPLANKLLQKTLKSIRTEKEKNLKAAVDSLYNDYKTNQELLIFTQLDKDPFYEAR